MTDVRADPSRLRAVAGPALDDLAATRRAVVQAHESVATMASTTELPAVTNLAATAVEGARTAVDELVRTIAVLAHVADEAERLDARFAPDGVLHTRLRRLATGRWPDDHLAVLLALDDPGHVAASWAALPAAVRQRLVRTHAATVGALDGVAVADRDRANRSLVAAEIRRLEATVGGPPTTVVGDPFAPLEVAAWQRRRHDAATAVGRLRRLLAADVVLLFDPRGDGRAAVAWGDLERAAHVTTFVPGMTSSLAALDAVVGDGRALHAALVDRARAEGPGPDGVATVAWLGYDAPSGFLGGLVEAAGTRRAWREQERLVDHVATLRAVNPGASRTVVAHSYGSVLALQALHADPDHDLLEVDRLVVLGSPGGGAGVEGREDAAVPRGGFFAASAPGDVVTLVPVLGPDPAGFDDVTALPQGPGNTFHGGYLAPGTLGAANVARAVLGLPLREVAVPWPPRRTFTAARPRTPWNTPLPARRDESRRRPD